MEKLVDFDINRVKVGDRLLLEIGNNPVRSGSPTREAVLLSKNLQGFNPIAIAYKDALGKEDLLLSLCATGCNHPYKLKIPVKIREHWAYVYRLPGKTSVFTSLACYSTKEAALDGPRQSAIDPDFIIGAVLVHSEGI